MAIDAVKDKRFSVIDADQGDGEWFDAVHAMHQRMLQEMDLGAIEKLDANARARGGHGRRAPARQPQMHPNILGDDREHVIRRVIDEAIGFGPIEPLAG